MSLGLELLKNGLDFSDYWLLAQDSVMKYGLNEHAYYRYVATTYLVRFRLVDEVLDGLSTNNLLTMLTDGG